MNSTEQLTEAEATLEAAKNYDLAHPRGIVERLAIGKICHERLVESCEGTPICRVAERMGGDNYIK